jgi:manganese-dependent inorganic pyrophosphatase
MNYLTKVPTPHYITGHRVPDADSLVGAHVFAWYLRESGRDPDARPVRLGEAGPQAEWIFKKAGEALPPLRMDCRYTVGEVMREVRSLGVNEPMRRALEMIHRGETDVVPITDGGRLVGLLSDRSQKTSYLMQCNVEDMIGTLMSLQDLEEGLELECVARGDGDELAKRIVFLNWERGEPAAPDFSDAIVIAGDQPSALVTALEGGARAFILLGEIGDATLSLLRSSKRSLFRYKGSMGSLVSRITGCFRCAEAMEESYPTLNADSIISTVRKEFAKVPYSLPVVDDGGHLLGMLSARMVLALQKAKVSLVDHFERSQSIGGIEEAELIEIIDHHRIGDIETVQPLRVDCRPLGSSATILYERCREEGLSVPPAIAVLLLGALVSDTLKLGSPTTTNIDRQVAAALAEKAGVDFDAFAFTVLRLNDRLGADDAETLVQRDCKAFTHGDTRFLAAQIETVDLGLLDIERLEDLRQAFALSCARDGSDFGVLMVTDVLCKDSHIEVVSGGDFPFERVLPDSVGKKVTGWKASGWVSRKKQLIPYVLNRLEETADG